MLTRLRSAVAEWVPAAGASDSLQAIIAAWPAIVGQEVAHQCRPLQISGKTLIVATRSSSWSEQLDLLSPRVLSAIAQHAQCDLERLRFRVGRLFAPASSTGTPPRRSAELPLPTGRFVIEARNAAEALANFHADVLASQRAKRAAGWKECRNCAVPLPRGGAPLCAPCTETAWEERSRRVSRLMFDAPWLGFHGTARLIEDLTRNEFEQIRKRVLQAWWEVLVRAQRARRLSGDGRERLVASSYVLLQTGFAPEEITPVIVRNLIGAELHELLYGAQ
ncbi:MAG: DUF721 domain-containing protein [Candidatus Eremiobacteraeota bacterium]|nr:DUF721 domain-containing protein [Candidatus Eremiobacteraeota bacterium]